jgi:hypothetical protein
MLDGTVIGDCMPRHRHQEFIRFLQLINVRYQPVHPNPQSESQSFHLERICRTNYGQNRQM